MPNVDRLRENLASVVSQVDRTVIFVNGSESVPLAYDAIGDLPDVFTIKSEVNAGVAMGLARIMSYAAENGFDWVLTIDQDSVCNPGLVEEYSKYIDLPKVGMLTCCIVDRNFFQSSGFRCDEKYRRVEKCITAGSFTSINAYSHTAGYDEQMFIDGVDWDICYGLRRHGYFIYQINFDGVIQEVGHGKNVSLFGKQYIAYGEPPLRNYYGARNDIYLARKYPEMISMWKTRIREIRAEVIVLLYEDQKFAKIYNRLRGVRDGFRMRIPTCDENDEAQQTGTTG